MAGPGAWIVLDKKLYNVPVPDEDLVAEDLTEEQVRTYLRDNRDGLDGLYAEDPDGRLILNPDEPVRHIPAGWPPQAGDVWEHFVDGRCEATTDADGGVWLHAAGYACGLPAEYAKPAGYQLVERRAG